jgi:hypothetical protein
MTNQNLVEIGYLNQDNQVSERFSHIGNNYDWEKDCERAKNLDILLNKLIGKKASEKFREECNQILDEIQEYHNYQPGFETADRLRHIYLMLVEERIDSVLRQDYSYYPKFGSEINPDSKQSIGDLFAIADSSLQPIERKSQSIEEWADDIQRAYVQGEKRPDFIGLLLQRYGECHLGSVYVQKGAAFKMTKQKGINLAELVSQAEIDLHERRNKGYSLFALERDLYLTNLTDLGHHLYRQSPTIKEKFDRLLQDEDFSDLNYTDVVGGPFNAGKQYKIGERTITERDDASYWAKEVANEIRKREPENIVFYLRRDPELISARILIPVPDFYGGLTDEEAIVKYGEATFDSMREHLTGITVSMDTNGNIRTPFSDLNYAFRKVTGQKTNPEMWD